MVYPRAGVGQALRYAEGSAPTRRPTPTAVPFLNGRTGDICIGLTHFTQRDARHQPGTRSRRCSSGTSPRRYRRVTQLGQDHGVVAHPGADMGRGSGIVTAIVEIERVVWSEAPECYHLGIVADQV